MPFWCDQIARKLEEWEHDDQASPAAFAELVARSQRFDGETTPEALWALNLYANDDGLLPHNASDAQKHDAIAFRDKCDKYTNAVLCLLNNTTVNPGEIPRPAEQDAQAEALRYECQLTDLPPMLGDPAGNLMVYLGLDAGVDRLSAKEALLSRNRRAEDCYSNDKLKKLLSNLPETSLFFQKALWRLVQDHVWRQLAFVRPGLKQPSGLKWEKIPSPPDGKPPGELLDNRALATKLETQTKFTQRDWQSCGVKSLHKNHCVKSGGAWYVPTEEPKVHADMHRLSLQYCQTEGLSKMVQGVSKHVGWASFKHHVRSLATHRSSGQQRAAGSAGPHRSLAQGEQMDAQTKCILAYNMIQMLFHTLQFGRGIVQLSNLSADHLVEAVHMAIGLHYYGIGMELDELGGASSEAFLVSLISQLLNTQLLVFAPHKQPQPHGARHYLGEEDPAGVAAPDLQLRRAIHYCLVVQNAKDTGQCIATGVLKVAAH